MHELFEVAYLGARKIINPHWPRLFVSDEEIVFFFTHMGPQSTLVSSYGHQLFTQGSPYRDLRNNCERSSSQVTIISKPVLATYIIRGF